MRKHTDSTCLVKQMQLWQGHHCATTSDPFCLPYACVRWQSHAWPLLLQEEMDVTWVKLVAVMVAVMVAVKVAVMVAVMVACSARRVASAV